MLDVPLGTLLEFGFQLLVQGEFHLLVGGNENPEAVGLVVVDLQEKGVRHLPLVIHPQFQAVLLRIKLRNELVRGQALDFHRVHLGIGRHESQKGRPQAHAFLLDDELFGGFLPEDVQFHVGLAGETKGRVLHVELLELVQGVVEEGLGPERFIQEGDAFLVGLVDVVVVRVLQGVYPVHGVLDVPKTEIPPVIGLGGRIGAVQEDGGVRMVLIQEDRRTFDGTERIAVLDQSRHAHRIDLGTRGEHEGESLIPVALVVIGDGAGEVQRIGRVGHQVGLEIHDQGFPGHLVLGLLFQRGREEDVVRVLDHHVLVEGELDLRLVRGHVHGSGKGRGLHQHRRDGVLGTTGRRGGGVRASRREHHRPEDQGGRDERDIF